eukprot:370841-Pelagomonas_calceolata.AAC.1
MAQASAPQAALILPDSRAVNAALAKHNISKDMEGPLREAVSLLCTVTSAERLLSGTASLG